MGRNHGGRYKLVAVRERTEVPCFLTSHMDGCQSGLLSFFAKEMLLQNNHRFESSQRHHIPMMKLANILDLKFRFCRFESYWGYHMESWQSLV